MGTNISIARGIMKKKGYDSTTKVEIGGVDKGIYLDEILEIILRDIAPNKLDEYFEEVLVLHDIIIIGGTKWTSSIKN